MLHPDLIKGLKKIKKMEWKKHFGDSYTKELVVKEPTIGGGFYPDYYIKIDCHSLMGYIYIKHHRYDLYFKFINNKVELKGENKGHCNVERTISLANAYIDSLLALPK